MYVVFVRFIYIVDISFMYIVDVSFEHIMYFLEKGNISVDMAFQGNNNWEIAG